MQNKKFGQKRDRIKRRRTLLELVVLAVSFYLLAQILISMPDTVRIAAPKSAEVQGAEDEGASASSVRVPPAKEAYSPMTDAVPLQRERGFVALSYVGVGTMEGETIISDARLAKHLQALHDRGYVTVSQQDIYDYYYAGKALPERALFLFFEDGRMQSAALAQPILEALNFQASMLSYANNLEQRESLFLSDEELIALSQTGYWEMGTNGYRLSYINVFDRHGNYLGEMTPPEYYRLSPYVRREYNHYLMDFVRDKYNVPIESYEQMQNRVQEDYRLMDQVYQARLGYLPRLYALMHANTGQFATNGTVSVENEKWIRAYFDMNFNREMLCRNDLSTDIYDLTRMQPQAYWSTNHLLMRIYSDTDQIGKMSFVLGDEARAQQWDILAGAAEWDENTIRVTSLPEGEGRIRLAGSERFSDFALRAYLDGNKMGKQSVDILSDPLGIGYTSIELEKNVLRVYAGQDGAPTGDPVLELDLDVHDGVVYQTWEENRQEAMAVEIDVKMRQAYKPEESKIIAAELIRAKADTSNARNEPYIPEITLKDDGSRLLEISVSGGFLSVWVDEKPVAQNIALPAPQGGGLALRSAWIEYGYSQRNLADDVYDGDFRDVWITSPDGQEVYVDYRGQEAGAGQEEAAVAEPIRNMWEVLKSWFR